MNQSADIVCQVPLPDARLIALRASASPLSAGESLQSVKLRAGLVPALRDRVLDAREMESGEADAWRVTFALDGAAACALPGDYFDFAAIVADRAVRGVFLPDRERILVLARSDDWIAGRLTAHPRDVQIAGLRTLIGQADLADALILLPLAADEEMAALHEALREKHADAVVRELASLVPLGGLPSAAPVCRQQQVWFPVKGGAVADDRLVALDIIVRPLGLPGAPDQIRIAGLPVNEGAQRSRLETLIRQMRRRDAHGEGEWETRLRFERGFEGASCELAVVMADRIARGREFPARGRLIASGAVGEEGRVDLPPDTCERKCHLIMEVAQVGDRILLPESWRDHLPKGFRPMLDEKGASCALLERVG